MIPIAIGYTISIALALMVVNYIADRFGPPTPGAVALLLAGFAFVGIAVGVEWGR